MRVPVNAGQPFRRDQAADLGFTRHGLTRAVSCGLLRRPLRGVYVDGSVPDTRDLRISCLVLVLPGHAVVWGRTAAWVWGVDGFGPDERDLVVPEYVVPHHRGRKRDAGVRPVEACITAEDVDRGRRHPADVPVPDRTRSRPAPGPAVGARRSGRVHARRPGDDAGAGSAIAGAVPSPRRRPGTRAGRAGGTEDRVMGRVRLAAAGGGCRVSPSRTADRDRGRTPDGRSTDSTSDTANTALDWSTTVSSTTGHGSSRHPTAPVVTTSPDGSAGRCTHSRVVTSWGVSPVSSSPSASCSGSHHACHGAGEQRRNARMIAGAA